MLGKENSVFLRTNRMFTKILMFSLSALAAGCASATSKAQAQDQFLSCKEDKARLEARSNELQEIEKADQEDIKFTTEVSVLCRTHLTLLNCKNVSLERKEQASDKVNQRRIKNNRLPLYSYYVASIGGHSVQFKSSSVKSGDHYRFHICRGHFKRRTTGTFWWGNHARGHKDQGMIVKDYKVEDIDANNVIQHVAEV